MTRLAPPLSERTGAYWRSGADGTLRIARCSDCGAYAHPPLPVCPTCRSRNMAMTPVSGRGKVWSCTINRYAWQAGMAPPYVIAEVELVEQKGLILISNILTDNPESVAIGDAVEVDFEQADEAWIPVFRA